jgi:hypothetical protein
LDNVYVFVPENIGETLQGLCIDNYFLIRASKIQEVRERITKGDCIIKKILQGKMKQSTE